MNRMLYLIAGWAIMLAVSTIAATAAPKGSRWGPGYFPNHEVTAHNGKTYRFYDDLIKDKIVLVNFIYTSCADVCPLMTARMAELQRQLGDVVGKRYFILSISLDPERDTPEKLNELAEAHGVGPGWLFITGDTAEMADIRYKLGERSNSLSEHRSDIVIGNDLKGSWRRTSAFAEFDRVIFAIRGMDHEWRASRQVKANYGSKGKKIHINQLKETGKALYIKICAPCHTVGGGKKIGPDLIDVGRRRKHDWLVKFIRKPGELRRAKDPTALALRKQFPGTIMPYLGLGKTDAEDLLTYIENKSRFLNKLKEHRKKNAHSGHHNGQHGGHANHQPKHAGHMNHKTKPKQ